VHVLGVRELDVSEGPGLDAVPVGGVLKGEGSADDFQGRVGTVNSSTFNAFDFQSKKLIRARFTTRFVIGFSI
jgi:hypothetical protein